MFVGLRFVSYVSVFRIRGEDIIFRFVILLNGFYFCLLFIYLAF